MFRPVLLVLSACLIAGAAQAGSPQDPGLVDTSTVEADGDRVIQLAIEIPASAEEVWEALTTASGWRRLGVRFAHVDFRVGGVIETSYSPDAAIGGEGNIQNQVIAYVPGRMLAIRNIKAPPGFPHAEEFATTATVMELTPLDAGRTRLTLTAMGFAPGEAYDALYGMFHQGNGATLRMLRASFEGEGGR